jgi:hypothetical protein
MRLWNDYEGTTIAEVYPIEKLIRPEGRSAFFSTSNGTGVPAVIRLIESINDEGEILTRWKTVADLKQAHLVTLKKFGQTVFEGTPLIYVLMESTEADLAGILQQGTLSVEDTRQLATSLVEATAALHASGMVHEHIEPINVLAAGEVVKLRSDCIREAPEGAEGIALMKRDVHDIAVVLLQALTQRKSLDAFGAARLPAPFDGIIRNGINGTWGLAQMSAALDPPVAKAVAAATQAATVAATQAAAQTAPRVSATATTPVPTTAPSAKAEQIPLAMPETASTEPVKRMSRLLPRDQMKVPVEDEEALRRRRWLIAIGPAVVVVLAAVGWHTMHKPSANETQPVTTLSDTGRAQGSAATAAAPVQPAAPAQQGAAVQQPAAAGVDAPRWRVVAFTYNHQDQAQHKVDELAQKDAALRPEVFSPNGGAPYLVTLGGAMTRADAAAFREKAAGEGLPRDSYIQNYGGHEGRRGRRR